MKLWSLMVNAVRGWLAIFRQDRYWRSRFTISPAGLVSALVIFLFAAALAVAFATMSYGLPHIPGLLAAIFVLALPIIAIVLSLVATRRLLKTAVPLLDLLVPGIYAATAFLLLEGLLALIGGPVVMLSWFALGYALHALARAAYGWSLGVAAAFATFTVLLLVAMRLALYMVTASGGSPI